jgi:LysM repeat protein
VRAGDNLASLSTFFGVPVDRILAMNPSIGPSRVIIIGSQLLIPTPTR